MPAAGQDGLYERTRILVGEAGIRRLQQAHVLVAGVGGVGSFAAEALGRAGIGRITLVDDDRVAPSNLNRQLPATGESLGQKKGAVMAARLAAINPHCQLEWVDQFITPESIPALLDRTAPDWVLDAIDSLNCKVALILEARARGWPVASSMGAGGRLDPSRIVVSDVMETRLCPLARAVRGRLRRRGCGLGVIAVWSTEEPLPHAPLEEMAQGRGRVVNGTISYLPALFGMTLAGVVIRGVLSPMR
ncbi:MAG: tRNA threonylcarbamoyladenosine dehydratase [Magnetococcales bacterium]|nr:tRNA threonylcarbamoyladenosine dehydratase [Magnetococcales bacterium]